jgi:IS5 family transposase
VKAALERAASDWRAHARQAEPLMRNHVATKTNRAAKKKAIG